MYSYYYSNGKLLITGEYLVLHGAKALALPACFGQSMQITPANGKKYIEWLSYEKGKKWFNARLSLDNFKTICTSDDKKASYLSKLLSAALSLNPDFVYKRLGYIIKTNLDFNRRWGLGGSSSLISNIAYWAGIDPLKLHFKISRGSGYDVAIARKHHPIIYSIKKSIPRIEKVSFNPSFREKLYFIYLNRKQSSDEAVKKYLKKNKPKLSDIKFISYLTEKISKTNSYQNFITYLREHEEKISSIIKQPRVKERYFPDFQGEIKSLGAWGGDFILACSSLSRKKVKDYFKEKKFNVLFAFDDLLIKKNKALENIRKIDPKN